MWMVNSWLDGTALQLQGLEKVLKSEQQPLLEELPPGDVGPFDGDSCDASSGESAGGAQPFDAGMWSRQTTGAVSSDLSFSGFNKLSTDHVVLYDSTKGLSKIADISGGHDGAAESREVRTFGFSPKRGPEMLHAPSGLSYRVANTFLDFGPKGRTNADRAVATMPELPSLSEARYHDGDLSDEELIGQ